MKVSENWLHEWVNPQINTTELAALLTMAGLEVDAINPVAGNFDNVIVAEVLETKAHPQANKLTICQVNNGNKLLNIVCGASNVRARMKVALAQIGASLPNGMTIEETHLRGELSQGMLCSASELGLCEQSEGILELDEDAPVGTDIRQYLGLDDQVIEVDLTPNRADCLSVLGIAREVSALSDTPLQMISTSSVKPQIDDHISVKVQEPMACPRYCGRIIDGINPNAQTPFWMRERLRRAGVRSINPVVDVGNYVMLEIGQPLHAFDKDALNGGIHVRFARDNEELSLLDGQDVQLNPRVLVIADETKALAIAGVMGGKDTSVHEKTTSIFLESAWFNPINIAGVARKFGLFTDASQRFERGVDPAITRLALERASELIIQIAGGKASEIVEVQSQQHLPQSVCISFNPVKVQQLTGLNISHEKMQQMLSALGLQVDRQNDALWQVKVPSYRFDMQLDVDLIEELVRLHGYDNIPGEPMLASVVAGSKSPLESLCQQAAQFFSTRAYRETISYSFVDPKLQQALYGEEEALNLLNPISSDLSQMRQGLWPGLLASMLYNIHRQQPSVKFFETGVIFVNDAQKSIERPCLAGLLYGEYGETNWAEVSGKFDFFDIKGDLQAFFASLKLESVQFIANEHTALHPGKSASINYQGHIIGYCGVLHPRFNDVLDIPHEVVLFELYLDMIPHMKNVIYQTISKFPLIKRDLCVLVDEKVSMMDIEKTIRSAVEPRLLKALNVFDVYQGSTVPEDKKSIALSLILQDENKTLIDNEINEIISAILKTLEQNLEITLRD